MEQKEEVSLLFVFGAVLVVIIAIVAVIGFFLSFTIVSPQQVGIITRVGSLNRSVGEGLHWKIPFFEGVTKMKIQEQKYAVSSQSYSKDGQTVDIEVTVNYMLKREAVESVYREAKNNYQDIFLNPVIAPAAEETLSKYTAQGIIENRVQLPIEIKNLIIGRVGDKGILIKGVELTKLDFDDAYESAIRNKQVKEQEALAQVNVTKQEEEKKKQEILKAEALAEKTRLESQALASQQGEKVITKIYAEAALEAAKKWNGVLPTQMIPGQTLPFIQLGK